MYPCSSDLGASLTYFTNHLGFAVKLILPAHDPEVAVVSGRGVTLRLDRNAKGPAPLLRLTKSKTSTEDTSKPPPEGIRIEWVEETSELVIPDSVPSFVVTRCDSAEGAGESSSADWIEGRAGMLYRDLVPDRQGGRFICSQIKVPGGGEVLDYVHHHGVRFQMIYCYKGWVEVVYEDQGPPFRMNAGDCVLQPPHIRHRVLSCSPGLEVIEISCPAKHDTLGDADLKLPTATVQPDRLFSGQRFMRYQSSQAQWHPLNDKTGCKWEQSNTGMDAATAGLAGARVLRSLEAAQDTEVALDSFSEFVFRFVLRGSVDLCVQSEDGVSKQILSRGDAFVTPPDLSCGLMNNAPDTEILEVSLPAKCSVK